MTTAATVAARLVLLSSLASSTACFRLSDPVYAFKSIQASEPEEPGASLIFGTIVVDEIMTGDLSTVSFEKIGPEGRRTHWGTGRAILYRVFFRRTMKDGHFLMEVRPGMYELTSFSTSGWGQPRIWNAEDGVRKNLRILVTRPGIYDLGSIRVARPSGIGNMHSYEMERSADNSAERQAVLKQAVAGTYWERVLTDSPSPPPATAAP